MNKLFTVPATLGLIIFSTILIASDDIMISKDSAWARATPPGSKTTAIYLTLVNHSGTDISLTEAAADISDRLELHTHINNNGMMKMQQVRSITVPAGGEASLKPHGDHIMVFNLMQPLKPGTEIDLELTFSNGATKVLIIPVQKESPLPDDHQMNHSDMHKKNSHTGHQPDNAS